MATCAAIVREVLGLGVEDEDRRRTWMADAEEMGRKGSVETARAIYEVRFGVGGAWCCAGAAADPRAPPSHPLLHPRPHDINAPPTHTHTLSLCRPPRPPPRRRRPRERRWEGRRFILTLIHVCTAHAQGSAAIQFTPHLRANAPCKRPRSCAATVSCQCPRRLHAVPLTIPLVRRVRRTPTRPGGRWAPTSSTQTPCARR